MEGVQTLNLGKAQSLRGGNMTQRWRGYTPEFHGELARYDVNFDSVGIA